ncbi:hypothetical protein OG742_37305 [Streptomyces sp. NBC_00828]|uniref:hypothetical protein n=1 Tax=Streptomyces sp. NBC_00828 TaxID=2903678 RepID=UPI003864C316
MTDPDFTSPLAKIEVRQPCPYCPPPGMIPRTLMAEHIRLAHPNEDTADADPGPDTCRPVEVDGETIRVRAAGELGDQEQEFLAELVRAATKMFLTEQADIVQNIVVLYREWCRAGPPPLGTPVSRWWDARIAELGEALARRPGAVAKEDDTAADARERWALQLVGILADLDRCRHGRHEGDPCHSCGGLSTGNPHLGPGRTLGYGLYGNPIVLPTRDRKTNPAAWRTTTTKDSHS